MVDTFTPIYGTIQRIEPLENDCCNLRINVRTMDGTVNLIISPNTYVADFTALRPRMSIVAFYDANAPVPLIYPPQYQAVVISRIRPQEFAYLGYFDLNLISEDNALQLNLSSDTQMETANGQPVYCNPAEKFLLVYYSDTTRSLPPQTTPRKIIIFCR